jgi:hypothetical protein
MPCQGEAVSGDASRSPMRVQGHGSSQLAEPTVFGTAPFTVQFEQV